MSNNAESDSEDINDSDSYDEIDDYYNNNDDALDSDSEGICKNSKGGDFLTSEDNLRSNNNVKKLIQELEQYEYECWDNKKVDEELEKAAKYIGKKLSISVSQAILVLQCYRWNKSEIISRTVTKSGRDNLLQEAKVFTASKAVLFSTGSKNCGVCLESFSAKNFYALPCGHAFCKECWYQHIKISIKDEMKAHITCMDIKCNLLCPRDFIEHFLKGCNEGKEYWKLFNKLSKRASITNHHQLRFCPGIDCEIVCYAKTVKPRQAVCSKCKTSFCFACCQDYHCPTDCETIKRWLTKCSDDTETANYISANTKTCPQCQTCIEKNGGCNHIQCSKCKHNFCWMCLGPWNSHGNSYYECSRYKENPLIAKQSQQAQARESLKKYLFYFERWENHYRSLKLEEEARKKIEKQINEKVMKNEGTWIDWQYLLRAGELLAKCRSTLQNTYPLVYHTKSGPEKTLFEYQQAQLEVEIETLAWKLERAGTYQRGDIENQMDIAEKRRNTLLLRFLKN